MPVNVEEKASTDHLSKAGLSQLTITCSKLTIETPEQGVKYVQS